MGLAILSLEATLHLEQNEPGLREKVTKVTFLKIH